MSKHFLDYDPQTGISHWVSTDEETGIATYGADQEVAAILDWNQTEYNEVHTSKEFWHVGSIPLTLYNQWAAEGILGDQKELAKRLNDIDFLKLRTRPGRI
jgi:hypothetical protein